MFKHNLKKYLIDYPIIGIALLFLNIKKLITKEKSSSKYEKKKIND